MGSPFVLLFDSDQLFCHGCWWRQLYVMFVHQLHTLRRADGASVLTLRSTGASSLWKLTSLFFFIIERNVRNLLRPTTKDNFSVAASFDKRGMLKCNKKLPWSVTSSSSFTFVHTQDLHGFHFLHPKLGAVDAQGRIVILLLSFSYVSRPVSFRVSRSVRQVWRSVFITLGVCCVQHTPKSKWQKNLIQAFLLIQGNTRAADDLNALLTVGCFRIKCLERAATAVMLRETRTGHPR